MAATSGNAREGGTLHRNRVRKETSNAQRPTFNVQLQRGRTADPQEPAPSLLIEALDVGRWTLDVLLSHVVSAGTNPRTLANRRSMASSDCTRAAFSPSKYQHRSRAYRRVARAVG